MQLIPNYSVSRDDEPAGSVLHYLEHQLPGYQFHARIHRPFVLELLADFPEIDVLSSSLRAMTEVLAGIIAASLRGEGGFS